MPRRDAVEDLLGDASPLLGKVESQQRKVEGRKRVAEEPAPKSEAKAKKPRASSARPPAKRSGTKSGGGGRRPSPASQGDLKAKRAKMSLDEERLAEEMCRALSDRVGAKVDFSCATRVLWSILINLEQSDLEAVDAPQLRKPANADALGVADFEAQIASYLRDVFRGA